MVRMKVKEPEAEVHGVRPKVKKKPVTKKIDKKKSTK